jgi:1-acyl-sn-glycerol-3-phosphate acyltransferase
MKLRRPFPLAAPTWPGGVERPPPPSRTGLDYDTLWARGPAARLARAVLVDGVLRPTAHLLARPRVDGRERLDALSPPAIFAANHHSHLDATLLLSLLPERFRRRTVVAAAADYFFPNRRRGAVSALVYGAFPVERTKVNRRSADMAADLLVDGWSLVIFPEGGRSPDGWGQEFRGGAAYLSVRTGRPVVPVYLEGTGDVWPKGSRWPHPGRVSVTFGIPLRADEGEDARRLNVRLEAAVAALADERESDWWTARRRAAGSASPSLTGPAASPWRRAWALPGDRAGRRRRPASWPQ